MCGLQVAELSHVHEIHSHGDFKRKLEKERCARLIATGVLISPSDGAGGWLWSGCAQMSWYSLSAQTPLHPGLTSLVKLGRLFYCCIITTANILNVAFKRKMGQILKIVFILSNNKSCFFQMYLEFDQKICRIKHYVS